MNPKFSKIIRTLFILFFIWFITKFFNIYYTIPIWGFLLFFGNYSNFEYLSVLICTELFVGIDNLLFGPISIIQIFAVFILLRSLKSPKSYKFSLFSNKLFLLLIIIFFYYLFSYFQYFNSISFSSLNWLFILVLTILTFDGKLNQLVFFSWIFILSSFLVILYTFIIQMAYFPDFTAAKKYSVSNSNYLGFFSLVSIMLSVIIYEFSLNNFKKRLAYISLFFMAYIALTGSRLNILILIIFLFIIFSKPIRFYWLSRKNISKIFIVGFTSVFFLQTLSNTILRNADNLSFFANLDFTDEDSFRSASLGAFTSGRSMIYLDGIELIKKKPIFGNGFLSWTDKNNSYNTIVRSSDGTRISMHSTLIQYWAETGIIGLFMYLLYLFLIIKNGKKLINSNNKFYYLTGVCVYYIPILLFFGGTLDNHSMSYGFIHFIAGISLVLTYKKKYEKHTILY